MKRLFFLAIISKSNQVKLDIVKKIMCLLSGFTMVIQRGVNKTSDGDHSADNRTNFGHKMSERHSGCVEFHHERGDVENEKGA